MQISLKPSDVIWVKLFGVKDLSFLYLNFVTVFFHAHFTCQNQVLKGPSEYYSTGTQGNIMLYKSYLKNFHILKYKMSRLTDMQQI